MKVPRFLWSFVGVSCFALGGMKSFGRSIRTEVLLSRLNLIDVSLYFRSHKKVERTSSRVGSLRMNFELGKMCQSCLQVTGISSLSGRFR